MREKKRQREIVRRRREREVDQSMPPIANDRETERAEESREKLMRDQRTIIPRATTEGALQVSFSRYIATSVLTLRLVPVNCVIIIC